jgi:hypothetical protein
VEVYALQVDYDVNGNSPWGMMTDEVDLDETWSLYDARALLQTWRPMPVTLHKGEQVADFVYFTAGGWAIRPTVRLALEPVLNGAVEYLPLACNTGEKFFSLHPLQLADLGPNSDVNCNRVSGNITVIRKYSFKSEELAGMVCFRVRHPVGSSAGPEAGCSDVLVSPQVKSCIELHSFRGVRCVKVFPTDERRHY